MKRTAALIMILCLIFVSAACSGDNLSCDITGVCDRLDRKYDIYDKMSNLSGEDVIVLYGVKEEQFTKYAAYISNSKDADEIAIFEAVDSGSAKKIEKRLKLRRSAKLSETKTALPDEYKKIKKCKVLRNGKYVALIVSADYEGMKDIYESSIE